MIRTLYIGNRPRVLEACRSNPHLELTAAIRVGTMSEPELPASISAITVSTTADRGEALLFIGASEFDLLVSAGCPWRLPISQFPRGRTYINCHPSALPLGRGRHPITEALIAEHRTAGVSVHHMDDGIDTGSVIASVAFPVTNDLDAAILYEILFDLEAEVFGIAVERLVAGGAAARGLMQSGRASAYSRPSRAPRFDAAVTSARTIVDHTRAWMLHGGVEVIAGHRRFSVARATALESTFLIARLSAAPVGTVCLEAPHVLVVRAMDGFVRFLEYSETG